MTSYVQGAQTSKQNMQGVNKFCRDNIIQRLPSIAVHKNTLTYFANKMKEYEEQGEAFKQKLEKYKRIYEDRHSLECELLKRRNKIGLLQNALSEVQNCFYNEREKKLKFENQLVKLKMEAEESRKKINHLLQMTRDQNLQDDAVHLFDESVGIHARQRLLSGHTQDEEQTAVKGLIGEDTSPSVSRQTYEALEGMKKNNEALHRMLEKQSTLNAQKIEASTRDCSVTLKEAKFLSKQDAEKIQRLIDQLKDTETELTSANEEVVDLRKELRREEILREMQKNVLLNYIMDSINCATRNDTVESTISKINKVIESAFDLFESVEKHDVSGCFKPHLHDCGSQTKNTLNLDIYPSKVHSETRSRSLENLSNKMDNKPVEKSNAHLKHIDSTGQFIHYSAGGDHCRCPHKPVISPRHAQCVSLSSFCPIHDKENFPKRNKSASNSAPRPRSHSCLKGADFLSEKSTTHKPAVRLPKCSIQFSLARPKTADPRRRKPPQNAPLRSNSVNQNRYSDNVKGGNILSGHSKGNRTPKNEIVDVPKTSPPKNGSGDGLSKPNSYFVPFPRRNSHKQSSRQVSASKRVELKTKPIHHTSEKTTQCNLDEDDSFPLNHQNNDRKEGSRNVIPKSVGYSAPKIYQNAHGSADLPLKVTQVHHNNEQINSSLSEDSALETLVKTDRLHETKQLDTFSPSSHKYCDTMIDNLRKTIKNANRELQEIQNRFVQTQIQLQAYEDRCASLERELSIQRNEYEASSNQQKKENDSLAEQLRTTKSRLNRLESYRRLEVEGFRTDIKLLTKQIREMQTQLCKTLLLYDAGGRDMEILQKVHSSATKSTRISNEVIRLKAKLYQLESALRQLGR